jgi:hypothetical protein
MLCLIGSLGASVSVSRLTRWLTGPKGSNGLYSEIEYWMLTLEDVSRPMHMIWIADAASGEAISLNIARIHDAHARGSAFLQATSTWYYLGDDHT